MENQIQNKDLKDTLDLLVRNVEELQLIVREQAKTLKDLDQTVLRTNSSTSLLPIKLMCIEHQIKRLYEDKFGTPLDRYTKEYNELLKAA